MNSSYGCCYMSGEDSEQEVLTSNISNGSIIPTRELCPRYEGGGRTGFSGLHTDHLSDVL